MRGEYQGYDAMIRTDRLAGWLIVAAVLYVPLVTWVPLTTTNLSLAVGQTPYWLLWCLGIGLIGCWIGAKDVILGLIVGYVALRGMFAVQVPHVTTQIPPHSSPVTLSVDFGAFPQGSLETMLMIALGAIVLISVQSVPQDVVKMALWVVAGIQVYFVAWQLQGMDPVWNGSGLMTTRLIGTLGQENYVGIVLGMILPLTARGVWIPSGVIFYALSNATGALALGFGLLRRYGLSWRWIGILAIVGFSILAWAQPISLKVRMIVWQTAIAQTTWWSWLVGHGWGSWATQQAVSLPGVVEIFFQAHNEPIQMYYDGGLLFLILCGWWIWSKREAWTGEWGGAALAVLVSTFGFFTFHAAIPALIGMVIVGTAIAAHREVTDDRVSFYSPKL